MKHSYIAMLQYTAPPLCCLQVISLHSLSSHDRATWRWLINLAAWLSISQNLQCYGHVRANTQYEEHSSPFVASQATTTVTGKVILSSLSSIAIAIFMRPYTRFDLVTSLMLCKDDDQTAKALDCASRPMWRHRHETYSNPQWIIK